MRYKAAGEAHGLGLIAVVDGVPAGLRIKTDNIDADVARWDRLHGRPSLRHAYDAAEIVGGVRAGRTIGSPVALCLARRMEEAPERTAHRGAVPRPATAELAGSLKRDSDDCLDVAERADAQVEAVRVAAAGVAREFLADVGVDIQSYVTRIGDAAMREDPSACERLAYAPLDIEMSALRCPSPQAARAMEAALDAACAAGETLSGEFRLVVTGVLPGIGDYAEPCGHLRARLAAALFSVEGVCGVEFGSVRGMRGTSACDAPVAGGALGFSRAANRAGGIEGGVASGAPILVRVEVAPAASVGVAVSALDMETLAPADAQPDVYDACRVPSAAVLAESEVAFVLASAYIEKFGGDAMGDIHEAVRAYRRRLARAGR